ncbi:UTP--glucose-1-phosphate uridylyltransferase GalU [Chloroflexota bacterium]
MKVRKAVITAAGWGTRFLPLTKSQPKEMLPLVDKPLIQYCVEEAIASGIEEIIMVTALGKRAIEDYFDRSFELESLLEKRGETALLKEIRGISDLGNICYVRQKEQMGLGHAILTARNIVGDEPFAVMLPDDIIDDEVPGLKQLVDVYDKFGTNVVAVERISPEETIKYGVIEPEVVAPGIYNVRSLVEKPAPEKAPSDLGIAGRYILMPEIFEVLEATPPGKNGELQLTDALHLLLEQQAMYARELDGVRYDAGTPFGWLKATLAFSLKRDDIGPELREYIRHML